MKNNYIILLVLFFCFKSEAYSFSGVIEYLINEIQLTIHNEKNKDTLFESVETILFHSILSCREKIGAFAVLKHYEPNHPVITDVINKLTQKHSGNIDLLSTIVNSVEVSDRFVFLNKCD